MKFLDTNVLVYFIDSRDPEKQVRARAIIAESIGNPQCLISGQVLNEFANVALRKLALHEDEVRDYIRAFRSIRTVETLSSWTDRALEIKQAHGLQFYDSLLLASAEANGCDEFWTEDLNDGQLYCGIRAVNPFLRGMGPSEKPC